jgi:hypothetical protein
MLVKTLLVAIASLVAASALPALAGGKSWGHSSASYGYHHDYRPHYRSPIGYTTPASRISGVGTLSRSVWVSGNPFRAARPRLSPLAPLATIIHVTPSASFRSIACAYEAGVCVIRVGN